MAILQQIQSLMGHQQDQSHNAGIMDVTVDNFLLSAIYLDTKGKNPVLRQKAIAQDVVLNSPEPRLAMGILPIPNVRPEGTLQHNGHRLVTTSLSASFFTIENDGFLVLFYPWAYLCPFVLIANFDVILAHRNRSYFRI